jgi:hypothetical protein
MRSVRRNGMVGMIEYDVMGSDDESCLHFSEWWSGEGLDFTFGNDEKKVSLGMDDISAIVTAALVCDMIDIEDCKLEAELIKIESRKRETELNSIKKRMGIY